MKLVPYWHDTAPRFQGCETGPVEGDYDVAVVGGGFTGLSAAIALARKGASVVLLEADRLGGCASGRNGGMCNNGFAQDYAGMVGKLGAETSLRLYQSFNTAVDTVETLIRAENIDCDFQRVGKLKMAAKPAHYDKLARSHELMVQGQTPMRGWSRARSWGRKWARTAISGADLSTCGTDAYGKICPWAGQCCGPPWRASA
ncbi:NAD(P)/FAD-dependent oxidoreductase [Sulfitobacter porphyrae]|uniref:NAD(P)/FAD-dependent oxidoreductase n=1 Tax=Sulfitobacter porphyrae TaxID=1246864 RepID=A0ABW2B9M9_9RHOB